MTRNYDVMPLSLQCFDSAKTSNEAVKKKGQRNQIWRSSDDSNLNNKVNATKRSNKREHKQILGNLSHITFNWDKKDNHLNACYELKGLLPVGDPCLVAGKDIPEVPQDCVSCTYYLILFQKDQEKFWALITQEQSQHFDPNKCTKMKLVLWSRRMHQASWFGQPMPELIRLMALSSNRLVWSKRWD